MMAAFYAVLLLYVLMFQSTVKNGALKRPKNQQMDKEADLKSTRPTVGHALLQVKEYLLYIPTPELVKNGQALKFKLFKIK